MPYSGFNHVSKSGPRMSIRNWHSCRIAEYTGPAELRHINAARQYSCIPNQWDICLRIMQYSLHSRTICISICIAYRFIWSCPCITLYNAVRTRYFIIFWKIIHIRYGYILAVRAIYWLFQHCVISVVVIMCYTEWPYIRVICFAWLLRMK